MKKSNLLSKLAGIALIALVAVSCKKEGADSGLQLNNQQASIASPSAVSVGTTYNIVNLKLGNFVIPPATVVTSYYNLATFGNSSNETAPTTAPAAVAAISFSGNSNSFITPINGYQLGFVDVAFASVSDDSGATWTTSTTHPTGFGNETATRTGWYDYTGSPARVATPKADRTILVRKGTELYKIEITSIYKDNDFSNPLDTTKIPYLTFKYVKLSN